MKSARDYYLDENYNCAEATIRGANDSLGLGLDDKAMKLLSGCGGGMSCGMTCGVLCSYVAALGELLTEEKGHLSPALKPGVSGFVKLFSETFGGTDCRDLQPKYKREGIRCAVLVEEAQDLFARYVEDHGFEK